MDLDYQLIGKRIAKCRRRLGLKQAEVEEMADIGCKYLSNIERGISIPSTEVIMRLAAALDTTPDEFLVGASRRQGAQSWKTVSDQLRPLNDRQLSLISEFIAWVTQNVP